MKTEVSDYVVALNGNKKGLYRVTKIKGDIFTCVKDGRDLAFKDLAETLTCGESDILANAGANPTVGISLAGVKIEPYVTHLKLKAWGDIYYFRDLTDVEDEHLVKTLKEVYLFLKSHSLHHKLSLDTEVRNQQGRYAGLYRYSGSDEVLDTLTLRPESIVNDLSQVVFHEIGHHVWFRHMAYEHKSKWIRAYHKDVTVSKVDAKTIQEVGQRFISSGLSIKEFFAGLSDEDEETPVVLDACLGALYSSHYLGSKELDTLIEAGEDISSLWPTTPLDLSDISPIISDYAGKSAAEYFAEAFRIYATGGDLPLPVKKLMTKTLRQFK